MFLTITRIGDETSELPVTFCGQFRHFLVAERYKEWFEKRPEALGL